MLRGLCFVISLLIACGNALAQDPPVVTFQCPSLYLDAPQWSLTDGDTAKFTVRIEPKPPEWKLKYNWTLSSGKIVSGQGTDSIVVERKVHYVDATVEIAGFPRDDICMRVASERATWSILPVAEKIKTFQGSKLERKFELGDLVDLGGFKGHNLIVFMGFKKGATDETIRTRESEVLKEIGGRLERDRYDLITVSDSSDVTEFWKVPLGAKNPTCETCSTTPSIEIQECPTISVSGPAGIVMPGETMPFSANISGESAGNRRYSWTISNAEIISGQGSLSIKARYRRPEDLGNITATIKVVGLPLGCVDTASDTFNMVIDPGPIKLGTITSTLVGKTLVSKIGDSLRKHPGAQLFVWVYLPQSGRPNFQIEKNRLLRQLARTKIDPARFTIVETEAAKIGAVFWLIRPGVGNPNP